MTTPRLPGARPEVPAAIRPAAPPPVDAQVRAERAAANAGLPTVEFAEATPYETYVGVRLLQALVPPVTAHPAEPAFLVVTQVMELWFTLLRREWELAQRQLRADDPAGAIASIRRSVHHLRSLDASWASLLGLKAESVVRPHRGLPVVHADLQRALAAPSLEDDVLAYLARRGLAVPVA